MHPWQECDRASILRMSRTVHVPYVLEQDEDGVWCASAVLQPGVGAVGDGDTPEAALTELRTGLLMLLDDLEAPAEMLFENYRHVA